MLSLSTAFVLLMVALAILGLSCCHIHLISFASNVYIDFGRITIFTRLLLPTHEHGRPTDFLVFSSIFPFSVLQFSCRGLVSLVRLIPRFVWLWLYFLVIVLFVLWVELFSSFIFHSVIDMEKDYWFFCMLILRSSIFLNVFIRSKGSSAESLGVLCIESYNL